MNTHDIFSKLGLDIQDFENGNLDVFSPVDGQKIASVAMDTVQDVDIKIAQSVAAFRDWRIVPAPRRGELVRIFGEILRENKEVLGALVALECGKIYQEGLGEVQEMIDICDFAVGLSRQLYGLTIASERPLHKMREIWQPLGPVGIISAFNFPVAVWAWNAALALVCGDSVIWKPSEKTPVTALVCQKLFERACARFGGEAPDGLSQLMIGMRDIGEVLVDDKRVPLISATGSTAMGRDVAPRVAQRFGKTILELGGNNAIIVAPSADLDLALQGIVFGAVGTCGQRCTTTRRLFVHDRVYQDVVPRIKAAYASLSIGNPLEEKTLVGPLIDEQAFLAMQDALNRANMDGGKVIGGERLFAKEHPNAFYVKPAIVEMPDDSNVQEETFAPILYIFKYNDLDDAIARQNDVPQGLSSSIFTNDIREAELFTSEAGSDCGIANINIGTSGAEIGGAFGGEKETGGGRESGSDSWKAYMRRMTSTVNFSSALPLAQGISFDVDD
ncbi:MAG: L-piperidine-6-carboxylate dehydrogenase [Alphaproteobacteria bacterium]